MLTSMAEEIPVTQARADFAELVNRVVYGGERIVVTRHGKPIVALVPAADLERLESPPTEVVIRLGSGTHTAESQPPQPQRLGIAAEHRPIRD
jgi:prevent-host-death family protein